MQYVRKISRKINIPYSLIRTRMCGYEGNTDIFLVGSTTKKCDHDCDQALLKSSRGSV